MAAILPFATRQAGADRQKHYHADKPLAGSRAVHILRNLIRGVFILIAMGVVFGAGSCGALGVVAGLTSNMDFTIVLLGLLGLGIAWGGVLLIGALARGIREDQPLPPDDPVTEVMALPAASPSTAVAPAADEMPPPAP
jgi:hypothetical protein